MHKIISDNLPIEKEHIQPIANLTFKHDIEPLFAKDNLSSSDILKYVTQHFDSVISDWITKGYERYEKSPDHWIQEDEVKTIMGQEFDPRLCEDLTRIINKKLHVRYLNNKLKQSKDKEFIEILHSDRKQTEQLITQQKEQILTNLICFFSHETLEKLALNRHEAEKRSLIENHNQLFKQLMSAHHCRLTLGVNENGNLNRYYINDTFGLNFSEYSSEGEETQNYVILDDFTFTNRASNTQINYAEISDNLPDLIVNAAIRYRYQSSEIHNHKIITIPECKAIWLGTLPNIGRGNSRKLNFLEDFVLKQKMLSCEEILKKSLQEGYSQLSQNKTIESLVFSGLSITEIGTGSHFEYYELRRIPNEEAFILINVNSLHQGPTAPYSMQDIRNEPFEHIQDIAQRCGFRIKKTLMHRIYTQTAEGCGPATVEVMLQRLLGTVDYPATTPIEDLPLYKAEDETTFLDYHEHYLIREELARLRHAAILANVPQTEKNSYALHLQCSIDSLCNVELMDVDNNIIHVLPAPASHLKPYWDNFLQIYPAPSMQSEVKASNILPPLKNLYASPTKMMFSSSKTSIDNSSSIQLKYQG